MATLVTPVEQKVILHGVSWETYERLLNEHQESPGTHFIYDEGALEILVLSRRHEEPNRDLAMLVQLVAMELGIDFHQLGSTIQAQAPAKGLRAGLCLLLCARR